MVILVPLLGVTQKALLSSLKGRTRHLSSMLQGERKDTIDIIYVAHYPHFLYKVIYNVKR